MIMMLLRKTWNIDFGQQSHVKEDRRCQRETPQGRTPPPATRKTKISNNPPATSKARQNLPSPSGARGKLRGLIVRASLPEGGACRRSRHEKTAQTESV